MKASHKTNASRRSMKGGYQLIPECWSFKTCKLILTALSEKWDLRRHFPEGKLPPGVGTNWNECIRLLASIAEVSPEELYNRMTPDEFLTKIRYWQLLYTGGGAFGVGAKLSEAWKKEYEGWREAKQSIKGRGQLSWWEMQLEAEGKLPPWQPPSMMALPGHRMSEARKAHAAAWEMEALAPKKKAMMEKWVATEPSFMEQGAPEEYRARVKQLEEGADPECPEECEELFEQGEADAGLCRAVRVGAAKRAARLDAAAKSTGKGNSSSAKGNLLGLNRKPNQKNNSTRKNA